MTNASYGTRFSDLGHDAHWIMLASDEAIWNLRSKAWQKRAEKQPNRKRHWESAIALRGVNIPLMSLWQEDFEQWFAFFKADQKDLAMWFRLATSAEVKYDADKPEE